MKKIILLILLLISIGLCQNNYVVILSLDGFRWDYPQKCHTPNFDSLASAGVTASIIPSFPSKTFPNHYTMATGLVPDHHGLVFNTHYNYQRNEWYTPSNRKTVENGRFYGGEPIWNTAERQGVKSATFFWVGSEANINNRYPTYWKKYQHDLPFLDRIDTVAAWLTKPYNQRPKLIMWYIHQPDSWGHYFGPDNEALYSKIEYLDSLIGVFAAKMNHLSIKDSLNIIVTTDHGMGQLDAKKVISLKEHLYSGWIDKKSISNPFFMVDPKPQFFDSVYNQLKSLDHMRVWKKGNIPSYLNYGTHENVMALVAVADSGWSLVWDNNFKEKSYPGGTHGYDPKNRDMHGIFYATGPNFKNNYHHPRFKNIHLYSLICKLLDITPQKTDGHIDAVEEMVK